MARTTTFPTLFDECKTISIGFLSKQGYLKPDQLKSGGIKWSRNGTQIANIGILTATYVDEPYLELDYSVNGKPFKYKVPLVYKPSNLRKGNVCFFKCPATGRLCRKLYLVDSYFLSRLAFKGCMYEKQTYSQSKRELNRQFEKVFSSEHIYEEIYSKHFKKFYNGKGTKRFVKLSKRLNEAADSDPDSVCELF